MGQRMHQPQNQYDKNTSNYGTEVFRRQINIWIFTYSGGIYV